MSPTAPKKCEKIREAWYPRDEWPGLRYEAAVAAAARPDAVLLEIGCGREGKRLRRMAKNFARGIGIDMEIAAQLNGDDRTQLMLGDAHRLALADESVDAIAMANVAEHLADPMQVLSECRRVLRPGGRLVIMTVNQWFPPIAAARLLPHRVRQVANRIASGTHDEDTFPVCYRLNTAESIRRAADAAGLDTIELNYIPHHPHYLTFSTTAYRIGILLERMIRPFENLRHMILGVFARPSRD